MLPGDILAHIIQRLRTALQHPSVSILSDHADQDGSSVASFILFYEVQTDRVPGQH